MNYSTTAALEIGQTLPPLALRHASGVAFALVLRGARRARAAARSGSASRCGSGRATSRCSSRRSLFGVEANGARRWLLIPGVPFAIQAAEPARLTTALAVAALLANATPKSLASWALLQRVALLVAPPVALLLLQPDFGSAVMLCAVVGFVLFAAGLPLRVLALPVVAGALGAALYIAARPYAPARVRGFVDPWQNAQAEGFQLVQSFVAFGRGGSVRRRARQRAPEALLPARGAHRLHPLGGRRGAGPVRRAARARRVRGAVLGGPAHREPRAHSRSRCSPRARAPR